MSMHVEWDSADLYVSVMTGEEATEEFGPDEGVTAPFVLSLGGASGGLLAIEGTRDALLNLADRIRDAVWAA